MISTRKVWFQHAPEWFLHTEYDFHTQNVNLARMSLIFTRKVWYWHARVWFLHARCDFNTNDSDFYMQYARVWFPDVWVCLQHTRLWFLHKECNFHKQNVISVSMSVTFTHIVWYQHARVWFLHTECDSTLQETDFLYAEYDSNTHECDFYTHNVIMVGMSVTSTREVWL
jgi:hypothetical protein